MTRGCHWTCSGYAPAVERYCLAVILAWSGDQESPARSTAARGLWHDRQANRIQKRRSSTQPHAPKHCAWADGPLAKVRNFRSARVRGLQSELTRSAGALEEVRPRRLLRPGRPDIRPGKLPDRADPTGAELLTGRPRDISRLYCGEFREMTRTRHYFRRTRRLAVLRGRQDPTQGAPGRLLRLVWRN